MEEFNASQNSTRYFFPRETGTQKELNDQERTDTLAQYPVLQEVGKHLDDRIAATDSVKEALRIATTLKITKEQALIVLDLVRQQLESERGYIANRVARVKK
jgi:hypothetical protein